MIQRGWSAGASKRRAPCFSPTPVVRPRVLQLCPLFLAHPPPRPFYSPCAPCRSARVPRPPRARRRRPRRGRRCCSGATARRQAGEWNWLGRCRSDAHATLLGGACGIAWHLVVGDAEKQGSGVVERTHADPPPLSPHTQSVRRLRRPPVAARPDRAASSQNEQAGRVAGEERGARQRAGALVDELRPRLHARPLPRRTSPLTHTTEHGRPQHLPPALARHLRRVPHHGRGE